MHACIHPPQLNFWLNLTVDHISILIVSYIEYYIVHEMNDSRVNGTMRDDDVALLWCYKIAIFGMDSHMWLNYFSTVHAQIAGHHCAKTHDSIDWICSLDIYLVDINVSKKLNHI
jgi:hypothetical protein